MSISQQYEIGKEATDSCVSALNEVEGNPIHLEDCNGVMLSILTEPGGAECVYRIHLLRFANYFRSEKAGLCVNVYDVRLKDKIPACGLNWPTDLTNITSYLRVRSSPQHYVLHYSLTQTAIRCFGCSPCSGQIRGMG